MSGDPSWWMQSWICKETCILCRPSGLHVLFITCCICLWRRLFAWSFNLHITVLIVANDISSFTVDGMPLNYASEFKHLGSVITNKLLDNADCWHKIQIVSAFYHGEYFVTSLLHGKCSLGIKFTLFRSFCVFYDTRLWNSHLTTAFNKMKACFLSVWSHS